MERKGLCDCLDKKDKEHLLVILDRHIRFYLKEISTAGKEQEDIIMSSEIDIPAIQAIENTKNIYDRIIGETESLISKIEDTEECKNL